MKIIRLTAENFKRLYAVDIHANGETVVISGKNNQGKSSVIDSIMAALGGRGSCPDDAVRHGAKRSETTVDLGELIVRRKITQQGAYLEVTAADGSPVKTPQAVLDRLVGKLSFDPLAYAKMSGAERKEALLGCLDLDIDLVEHEDWRQERPPRRSARPKPWPTCRTR